MITIKGLKKIYPSGTKAVDELDLTIKAGEILALLGPNGAGKSTIIKILTTLCGFDDGYVEVSGFDIDKEPGKIRQAIGCVAQDTGVDFFLTGRENLALQGHLYRMSKTDINARISELADFFGLTEQLKLVSSYSGGMRRKLDIATSLIHRPKILFLDEPTLGLDTTSRQNLWKLIHQLNQDFGLTILLTSHYLEEADKLAHRVAIINHGKIKIVDTPEQLKNSLQGDAITLEFASQNEQTTQFAEKVKSENYTKNIIWENKKLHLYVNNGTHAIPKLMSLANHMAIEVQNISFARPTLDDVFIKYTGTSIDANEEEATEQWWEKWAGKGDQTQWSKKWQKNPPSQENTEETTDNQTAWPEQQDTATQSSDQTKSDTHWPNQPWPSTQENTQTNADNNTTDKYWHSPKDNK